MYDSSRFVEQQRRKHDVQGQTLYDGQATGITDEERINLIPRYYGLLNKHAVQNVIFRPSKIGNSVQISNVRQKVFNLQTDIYVLNAKSV